jgi:hypothetical protein
MLVRENVQRGQLGDDDRCAGRVHRVG